MCARVLVCGNVCVEKVVVMVVVVIARVVKTYVCWEIRVTIPA